MEGKPMPHVAEIIRKTGTEYKPMRAHNDGREWLAGLLVKARLSPNGIYSGSAKAIEDYAEDIAG